MKVTITKKEIDTTKVLDKNLSPSYLSVENIDYCCDGMKKFFKDRVIGVCLDEDFCDYDSTEEVPFVGIRQVSILDTGYESFDGEDEIWVPDYEEEESFVPIRKCPCCGEDIELNVEVLDITDAVNNKLKMLPKHKKTKAEKELIKTIHKDINEIVGRRVY